MLRGCGLDSKGSGLVPVMGFCEHGNEPSGFIRREEFFVKRSDYQLFKNE
jgi:hypothetical protein